jgi:hypothetical protein
MSQTSEIIKAIANKYIESKKTYSFYFDHAPINSDGSALAYPVITFKIVDVQNNFSMPNKTYNMARVQFNIYGNENQFSDLVDIMGEIEDLYHLQTLTVSGYTHVCTKFLNKRINYYDGGEKIYTVTCDCMIFTG